MSRFLCQDAWTDHPMVYWHGPSRAAVAAVAAQLATWNLNPEVQTLAREQPRLIARCPGLLALDASDWISATEAEDFLSLLDWDRTTSPLVQQYGRPLVILYQAASMKWAWIRFLERRQEDFWFWIVSTRDPRHDAAFFDVHRIRGDDRLPPLPVTWLPRAGWVTSAGVVTDEAACQMVMGAVRQRKVAPAVVWRSLFESLPIPGHRALELIAAWDAAYCRWPPDWMWQWELHWLALSQQLSAIQ